MLLAEELLLLVVKKKATGSPSFSGLHAALAAAVLVEMAEAGQLTITGDRVTVHRGDGHPLAPHVTSATVARAVTHTGIGLYPALLGRLTARRTLTLGRTWRGKPLWRLDDEPLRAALVAELAGVTDGDVPPTTRTGALLGLLHALDAMFAVFPLAEPAARERAARLAQESWPVRAFTGTVSECERSYADLPGVLVLDDRPEWVLTPSERPPPSP